MAWYLNPRTHSTATVLIRFPTAVTLKMNVSRPGPRCGVVRTDLASRNPLKELDKIHICNYKEHKHCKA